MSWRAFESWRQWRDKLMQLRAAVLLRLEQARVLLAKATDWIKSNI